MLTLKDQILLSPVGHWASRNGKLLLTSALLLFLAAGGWGINSLRTLNKKEVQIDELLSAWKNNPADKTLFQSLLKASQNISGPHPIHPQIAQVLLATGRCDEAEKIAKGSLEQLRKIAPEYADFSEISFCISRHNYQEALERSVSLKEMLEDKSSVLYGKNLLRIAFLQQQLNNRSGETAAWEELHEMICENQAGPVLQGLGNQKIGFQAYLKERKKVL